jgi:hypothetical protein
MKNRSGDLLPDCPSCLVKCGGGCAKKSWESFGDLVHSGENKQYCDSRRKVLEQFLKNLLLGQTKSTFGFEDIAITNLKELLNQITIHSNEN